MTIEQYESLALAVESHRQSVAERLAEADDYNEGMEVYYEEAHDCMGDFYEALDEVRKRITPRGVPEYKSDASSAQPARVSVAKTHRCYHCQRIMTGREYDKYTISCQRCKDDER